MTLDEIWSDFTETMAEIAFMQGGVRSSTKNEMQRLINNQEAVEPQKKDAPQIVSMHNFMFKDIKTGSRIFCDLRELTAEEAKHHLLLWKNKQYQWLLVEAYEAFEKLLVHIYALVGVSCLDFWPIKDRRDLPIEESPERLFPLYLERSKNKQNLPHSILTILRSKFPALSSIEINNYIGVNLRFAVALVANLRHQIVHTRGYAQSKNDFISKTAKKIGAYNNGMVSEQYSEYAEIFFGNGHYENMVTLLEITADQNAAMTTYACRLTTLMELLLGYGHALVELVRPCTTENTI